MRFRQIGLFAAADKGGGQRLTTAAEPMELSLGCQRKNRYIDSRGDWAIEPVFDEARPFHGEKAAAKFHGQRAIVHKQGSWKEAASGAGPFLRCHRLGAGQALNSR